MRPGRHTGLAHLEAALADLEALRHEADRHDCQVVAQLRQLTWYPTAEARAVAEQGLVRGAGYQDGLVRAIEVLRRHVAEYHTHHPRKDTP